jgi:hypothetical protein
MIGLRDIAAFMAARGVAGGAAALTRAALAEYWMQAGMMREATTRRMLASFAAAGGALDPSARALAGGRRFSPRPSANPLTPYDEREWQHLQRTCRLVADSAFARHRDALAAAGRGRDPASAGLSEDNLRWLLARSGPASAAQIAARLDVSATCVTRQGDVQAAFAGLFPGTGVVIAYRALLGSYCGVVPDGTADLSVGDINWAGDATVLLSYVKHRTAQESVTLPRRAARLLEHSALPAATHPPSWPAACGCTAATAAAPAGRPASIREHIVTGAKTTASGWTGGGSAPRSCRCGTAGPSTARPGR